MHVGHLVDLRHLENPPMPAHAASKRRALDPPFWQIDRRLTPEEQHHSERSQQPVALACGPGRAGYSK
jgi:hypothetical protein